MKAPEQLYLDGTAPPRNEQVDEALYAWLDAQERQRGTADATKVKHAVLLARMAEAKVERYPYLDPSSGKKRTVVVARDPKAKTLAAPKERKPDREPKERKPKPETVESRKVPRAQALRDIAEHQPPPDADPFDATRQAMDAIKPTRKRKR